MWNIEPRAAEVSTSRLSVRRCRSAIGVVAPREFDTSKICSSSLSAYSVVRDASASAPSSMSVCVSSARMNPSVTNTTVFGSRSDRSARSRLRMELSVCLASVRPSCAVVIALLSTWLMHISSGPSGGRP